MQLNKNSKFDTFFIGLLSLYALASKEAADLKNRVFGGATTEEETIPTAFYDIKNKIYKQDSDSYSEEED